MEIVAEGISNPTTYTATYYSKLVSFSSQMYGVCPLLPETLSHLRVCDIRAAQRLCNGRVSVRLSVCLFRRSPAAATSNWFAAARARAADIERSLLRLLINTYRRRRVPQSGQRHAVVRGTTVDADMFLPRDAKYPRY